MTLSEAAKRAKAKAIRFLLPPPFQSQWSSYSYVGSATVERARPDTRLLDLAIDAIKHASHVSFPSLAGRLSKDAMAVLEFWPGEHYRLIASICDVAKPKRVVEIGTASGLSALAMLSVLPTTSQLISFDVFPWNYRGPGTWGGDTLLREDDFHDGRLRHEVGDLSDPAVFDRHRELIESTDLFFIDGPKDGRFEPSFLKRLSGARFKTAPLLVLDDIKFWTMLATWHEIAGPKLDLTSFGHWSGTGLVRWQ